jgi:hypothetical protein
VEGREDGGWRKKVEGGYGAGTDERDRGTDGLMGGGIK